MKGTLTPMPKMNIIRPILLIITAFLWGFAFVAQRSGSDAVGPYTFNCIRSIIGAIVLIPVVQFTKRFHTTEDKRMTLRGGICCGIILFLASTLQTLGLYYGTSAGKAGFLTACYIIIVPFFGIFLNKKVSVRVWMSVFITLIGLYLLCINGTFSLQFCDLLVLLCAIGFAIHILVIDYFSPIVNGVRMSCIQFAVCGIISIIPMYVTEIKNMSDGLADWLHILNALSPWIAILYAGVCSCGIAYTLQIIGQKGVNPTVASLLMSLESVFSVIGGWLILHEQLSVSEIAGCGLIFVAVVMAQISAK